MLFVKNGPEVPEHLLEAHEDGRVVFFCGCAFYLFIRAHRT